MIMFLKQGTVEGAHSNRVVKRLVAGAGSPRQGPGRTGGMLASVLVWTPPRIITQEIEIALTDEDPRDAELRDAPCSRAHNAQEARLWGRAWCLSQQPNRLGCPDACYRWHFPSLACWRWFSPSAQSCSPAPSCPVLKPPQVPPDAARAVEGLSSICFTASSSRPAW